VKGEADVLSRGHWKLLVHAVGVNFVLGGFGFNYIIMLVPEVRDDLGIDLGGWGLLWSGISLGTLLASIPGGALGDRFGGRPLITIGLAVSGGSLLLRAAAGRFSTMLLAMVLYGVGLGIVSANVPKALGSCFPSRRLGLANGVALAGVGAGQALGALFALPIVRWLDGWRSLTVILGMLLLGMAGYGVLAARAAVPDSAEGSPPPLAWPTIATVLRVKAVWILALCYMTFFGGLVGVIGYFPTYLAATRGLDREFVAIVVSLAPWTYVVGSACLPALSDRSGRRRTVYSVAIVASAALVVGHAYFDGLALVMTSVLLGLSAGAAGIVFVIPVELTGVGPRLAGTALGLIVTAGSLGGAVVPALGMRLAEARPATGVVFFAAALLTSALLFLLVRASSRTRGLSEPG
jgi:nitrate/nitrite transporter NarK